MAAWSDASRPSPAPCKDSDQGLFEVYVRDGRARLGKLHTSHGILETPTLLPVINPNIRTIEPREMWDRYGIGALITNSYIIWKHEELKSKALNDGVHELLDYPGVVMTDSGTFQSYVYGDVEVGVEEIVNFQKSIGVDIATMLDVFSRPDMTEREVEEAVEETILRSGPSVVAAGDTMLNGPIQGGIFKNLREKSAQEMAKFDFSVHPIGGIVPIMEQQRYREYAKIMLSTIPHLPPNRPVHMFGCGHPMLFPMSVALGADLFDSAAYALFARDGRILTPWGTEKIEDMVEWPIFSPAIANHTPEEVRSMNKDERIYVLSKYNLEISLAELSRCRQAVRDGTIWRLVEKRSHQHPALRDAFLWLTTNPLNTKIANFITEELPLDEKTSAQDLELSGSWEQSWQWLLDSQTTPRKGGEQWAGSDTLHRPSVIVAQNNLKLSWHPRDSVGKGSNCVLIFFGSSGPWRDRCDKIVAKILHKFPGLEIMINTPLGIIPYSLEDLNPFCHVEGPDWIWKNRLNIASIRTQLDEFNLGSRVIIPIDLNKDSLSDIIFSKFSEHNLTTETDTSDDFFKIDSPDEFDLSIKQLNRWKVASKLSVLLNMNHEISNEIAKSVEFVINRHGRIKNVLSSSGSHLFSFRLTDGGISLTNDGAIELFNLRRKQLPTQHSETSLFPNVGLGPAVVVVNEDSEPFVRKGRNVFNGFITATDPWIRPGQPCLICNQSGELIGHGVSQFNATDLQALKKGVAVKTRDGISS